jgi:hypothetical protein
VGNQLPSEDTPFDVEKSIDKNKQKSTWTIIRYPIGIIILCFYLYIKIQQNLYPSEIGYNGYKNAAQQGGANIASVLIVWIIFYIFFSRKNGPLLNLVGPIFAFTVMWAIEDLI